MPLTFIRTCFNKTDYSETGLELPVCPQVWCAEELPRFPVPRIYGWEHDDALRERGVIPVVDGAALCLRRILSLRGSRTGKQWCRKWKAVMQPTGTAVNEVDLLCPLKRARVTRRQRVSLPTLRRGRASHRERASSAVDEADCHVQ